MRNRALVVAEERQLTGVITGHTLSKKMIGMVPIITSTVVVGLNDLGFLSEIRRNEIRTYQWTMSIASKFLNRWP